MPKSSFAKKNDIFTRLIETYAKLVGMHSDHYAKEKKRCQPYESKENGCN